ncbi:MAG: hypothetical protein A2Z04_09500 [Chloroflexi bacterium RBG_16_57_9]|nr:MAG: hypothetical protein A2Z04_09500 [Chloroflexi bacterium RBG_16_57_9]
MAVQNVTLHLPEAVMRRARQAASALQRPLEDVLTDTLAAALPDVEDAPSDLQTDLARMTWLNDHELWAIARSTITEEQQNQLYYLTELQSQRPLTQEEQTTLETLCQEYGRVTLRKARAYALLSLRGGRPLLANN